jgi:hypothetical protein
MAEVVAVNVQFVGLHEMEAAFAAAGLKGPYALAKAIDSVGNRTTTQVKRSLVLQTGAKYGRVSAAIVTRQAMGAGEGSYQIVARDVYLSLKEFGPKQTKKGVSAAPWRKRRVFPHTFIGPGGHVFERVVVGGKRVGRLPLHKLSGPAIPKEMVKDETEATFFAFTARELPIAIEKALLKAAP